MKDNLYKYDVIIMKDTDTGAQTYIVADRGPVHPARNGSRDGQKNNARWGERFSTRQNKRTVAEMETVASVPGYEGSLKASDVIKTVAEFFDSIGNTVENEELGSIVLQRRGVKNDIAHGIGREKAAAFMAVPDVLKHGKVVDYQGNWKGRGYDTAIIAAPIQISGEDYFAGVCVKSVSGENKFYVHEVLSIKEGATPFNRAALETSVDSGGDTPSINNILSELIDVKENLKYSSRNGQNFAENQTETENFKKWFGDWQNDPAKASKVVNEDGTPKVVYHGTNAELKGGAEYLKQVVQIQKKHHLPESAAVLPVTAPIHRRTGPAYRGPHGRRRRARAGR